MQYNNINQIHYLIKPTKIPKKRNIRSNTIQSLIALKVYPCVKDCIPYHIINMPNITHCGLSISMGMASSSSSSGKTGASLSTVVRRLTVETVTRRRNAVSTNEHLLTGLQCKMEVPRGIKMAARAQSTMA